MFKPLIKNDNKYIFLNPSWSSPAFYEAIMSKLRKNYDNFDDRIGIEFENYVKQELNAKNISYSFGKYIIGRKKPECDLIIETENTIVFVEIKKKAITRDAKAGDEIKLILDLSMSFLDATLQSGNHELNLREKGYLEFENGNKLYLKNRSIERVALTLLDFGGFQDRVMLDELFKIMLISDFQVNNSEFESDFEEIKEKILMLRTQGEKLAQYDGFYKSVPFHNCWFLSLPQLLMLLDDSVDNDSFVNKLISIKFVTTSSIDYYYDYTQLNRLLQIS